MTGSFISSLVIGHKYSSGIPFSEEKKIKKKIDNCKNIFVYFSKS
jgi:hypothetical protein